MRNANYGTFRPFILLLSILLLALTTFSLRWPSSTLRYAVTGQGQGRATVYCFHHGAILFKTISPAAGDEGRGGGGDGQAALVVETIPDQRLGLRPDIVRRFLIHIGNLDIVSQTGQYNTALPDFLPKAKELRHVAADLLVRQFQEALRVVRVAKRMTPALFSRPGNDGVADQVSRSPGLDPVCRVSFCLLIAGLHWDISFHVCFQTGY